MSVCVKKYMCIYFKVLCRACISAGPLHEPFGVKGAENDRSPNLKVASSQRTLRTRKAGGMCIYIYILCCHGNDGFNTFVYTPQQNST